ncbi:hypothetical protein BJ508DRAFT_331624 [Ascobolus immersus RN42]|uniref:Uncharacterized protein n=1 Tax=Ascobolus immersus RN42 TaxID=1160509 RepID=A0A3N4HQC8_ASCIM|nr:hypothetical protein BJ508DRAFT_331624 [Ascobolus immersus RN42]
MANFLDLPLELHLEILKHHVKNIYDLETLRCRSTGYGCTYPALIRLSIAAYLAIIFALFPSKYNERLGWSTATSQRAIQVGEEYAIQAAWGMKDTFVVMAVEAVMYNDESPSVRRSLRAWHCEPRNKPCHCPTPLSESLYSRISRVFEEVVETVEYAGGSHRSGDDAKRMFWKVVIQVWENDERYPVRRKDVGYEADRFRLSIYIPTLSITALLSPESVDVPWERAMMEMKGSPDLETAIREVSDLKGVEALLPLQDEAFSLDSAKYTRIAELRNDDRMEAFLAKLRSQPQVSPEEFLQTYRRGEASLRTVAVCTWNGVPQHFVSVEPIMQTALNKDK